MAMAPKLTAEQREMHARLVAYGDGRHEAERLLREAQNALLDYVERLEKQGGMMGYGRSVLRQIDAYLSKAGP